MMNEGKKISVGRNPIGTHIYHLCFENHRTLKPRGEENYKCQKCLEISFENQQVKDANAKFLPLKELDKLI